MFFLVLLTFLLIGCANSDTRLFVYVDSKRENLDIVQYKDSINCNSINTCTNIIKHDILRNWQRPINGGNLSVGARISIDEFFEVSKVEIVTSSGNRNFDNSIISAIWKSKPFKELAGLPSEDFNKMREIEFLFGARKPKNRKMESIIIGTGSSI